jgi:hypothetical protein
VSKTCTSNNVHKTDVSIQMEISERTIKKFHSSKCRLYVLHVRTSNLSHMYGRETGTMAL